MKSPSKLNVYSNVSDMIGHTPLLKLGPSLKNPPLGRWVASRIPNYAPKAIESPLYAKVEYLNPGGSVKDRIAKTIIENAEKRGDIKPGATLVEATSGNTGAGLAMLAALKGYKAIFVMPDKMSAEKINVLRAYGAKVVIAPATASPKDPTFYVNVAARIAKETAGAFLANQYYNMDNPGAHYEGTGPEIWEQMEGNIDVFVAGIGTGGTLSGTAHFLREKNPKIEIVAVDPKGSIFEGLITKGVPSEHHPYLVEGIGQEMVPGTMDLKCMTDCVKVWDDESFSATQMLAQREGLLVGGSCGTAFWGAVQYLQMREAQGAKSLRSVVLLPDSGTRYLSKVFNSLWLDQNKVIPQWGDAKLGGEIEFIEGAKRIAGI